MPVSIYNSDALAFAPLRVVSGGLADAKAWAQAGGVVMDANGVDLLSEFWDSFMGTTQKQFAIFAAGQAQAVCTFDAATGYADTGPMPQITVLGIDNAGFAQPSLVAGDDSGGAVDSLTLELQRAALGIGFYVGVPWVRREGATSDALTHANNDGPEYPVEIFKRLI